jgi:RNA polymerase sigma factor (sigma-70 family)
VPTDAAVSDDALNRQVMAGDRKAFDILVTRHQARLRGFLRKLSGNAAAADDLAQETFVRAWQRCGQFDGGHGGGNYPAWLVRIAWRVFLDAERHEQHLRRKHSAATEAVEPAEPNHGARLDVMAALATLPARDRACVLLCDVEGWSHTEAAQLLDLPLGTLKSIILRARDALRRHLYPATETHHVP